jgi:hypothetical protein
MMAKKKEHPKPKETRRDEQALVEALLKVEGVNREIAEHAAKHGVPNDVYVVQTFYRVSAMTAEAMIKVLKS